MGAFTGYICLQVKVSGFDTNAVGAAVTLVLNRANPRSGTRAIDFVEDKMANTPSSSMPAGLGVTSYSPTGQGGSGGDAGWGNQGQNYSPGLSPLPEGRSKSVVSTRQIIEELQDAYTMEEVRKQLSGLLLSTYLADTPMSAIVDSVAETMKQVDESMDSSEAESIRTPMPSTERRLVEFCSTLAKVVRNDRGESGEMIVSKKRKGEEVKKGGKRQKRGGLQVAVHTCLNGQKNCRTAADCRHRVLRR